MTLFFLSALRDHLKCLPPANGLRLVISISEAHNIFSRTGEARPSEESANPLAYVVALIKRLEVELRALGVGIILTDQHPSELDPSAVKSPGTTITCREIHSDDREVLAASMLLAKFQAEDLVRLRSGEGYFFKEGFYRPIRIKMENLHEQLDLKSFPTDDELLDIIKNEKWFQDMAIARTTMELDQLMEHMDQFEAQRITIMKRAIALHQCYLYILKHPRCQHNNSRLAAVIREACKLNSALRSSYKAFQRGPYKMYSPDLNHLNLDDGLRARAVDLSNRFESVIKKGTESVVDKIEKLIQNCKTLMRKRG
jgi:hypothetical protein